MEKSKAKLLSIILFIVCLPLLSLSQPAHKSTEIAIQPYGNIPPSYVSYVYTHLKEICAGIVINNTKPLPLSAYTEARKRYRADSLVDMLSRETPNGQITIGLTIQDISYTMNGYPDWGIFGLSECPGKACIASSFRSKTDKPAGLYFTAIHEIGHTMGLPHCTSPSCLMNDANGHTIEAIEFCPKCKAFLREKGWRL